MYARGVYFALPGLSIVPGDVVVDLGANRGLFTLLALKLGASRVVAVEAQSGFIPLIQELLEKNDCASGAILVSSLVGTHTGLLFNPAAQAAASHWRGMPPRRSICELMRAYGIDRIDFLKVDIEGSEFDLFEQASDWLPKVGRLAMEVHGAFGAASSICKVLLSEGFKVKLAYPDLTPAESLGCSCGYLYAFR
jgi:FkbM family methyltransferase